MLLWVDLETTGLKPTECALLEVALVVTTNDLQTCWEKSWVLPFDQSLIPSVDPYVQAMHAKSGLWAECADKHAAGPAGEQRRAVADEILAELRRWTEPKSTPICGSTIAFDRAFLVEHMPAVAAHFSHRNLDVSVLGELALRWAPDVHEGRPKGGGHRALPDIQGSIALLKYWRASLGAVLK